MATRKAEIAVTCNITQPKQAQKILVTALEALQKKYELLVSKGKENEAETQKLKATMEGLASAVSTNEQNMNRIKSVMDNLSGSTLRQLNTALRELKRQMNSKSTNSSDLDDLKEKYRAITEQIKILKGETVDIAKGISDLSSQTDAWLTKAIAKQKELVAQTQRNNTAYDAQVAILTKLEAEQNRRANLALSAKGNAAMSLANNPANASMAQLRTARQDLINYRDSIGNRAGANTFGSTQQNADMIKTINEMLKAIDKQIESINGKEQKVAMTTQDLVQSVSQIDFNKATPTQLKSKLDEVNQALANMAVNDPMRTRLVESAKQLQQALNAVDKEVIDVQTVLANLDKASPKQLKAALDQVNHSLEVLDRTAANKSTRAALVAQAKQLRQALADVDKEAIDVQTVLANLDKASPKQLKAALDQVNHSLEVLDRTAANKSTRAALVAQAKQLRQALAGVDKEAIDVKKVLDNIRKEPIENLRKAAAQLEQEIAKLNRDTKSKEYKKKREELRQIRQEIERTNRAVSAQSGAWRKTFQAISAYMGVTMIIGRIISMLTSVINLNLKLSDQLANIRKVSGLAMHDVLELSDRLASIDTRTTIQELNEIAYAGAKLGMGKYGIEGLEGFVRAANQVNVALKEDMGADALTALSKITEVMGLIPKMGVEKSMLATGSALFQLSATSTATSSNIVEFSKRLTGMARVAGITTDQLLGLGSAADSMFLMPEVASTAFNKFIAALQTKHNLIEKELSIEPGTISQLYEAGKIVDAMILVFEKMKEKGNMNALGSVFKDLGSEGARLVNVMVTMSQNVDMLRDHLDTAKEAFEEATAVTNEYNIQQETAQALMERASNVWQKAFINRDGVDSVQALAKAWYDMSVELTRSDGYMASLKASLWGIITLVKLMIHLLPGLLTFMLFKGVHAALMGVAAGYNTVAGAIGLATIKQNMLNMAQKANVWLALASAIIFGITVLYKWITAANKAAESQKKINNYLADAESEYQKQKTTLKSYLAVLEDVNTSTEQRERILRKFNKEFQPYLDKLGVEIKSVQDLKDNYAALNDEIRKKMYYQMRETAYKDLLETDGDENSPSLFKNVSTALLDYSRFTANSLSYKAFDTGWLEEQVAAGRNAHDIAYSAAREVFPGFIESKGYFGEPVYHYNNDAGQQVILNFAMGPQQLQGYIQRYIDAKSAYDAKRAEIDKAFDPILHGYDPNSPINLGALENEAPDKDAMKEAQRASDRQKHAYKEEIKQLQGQVTGIIDNLKNFYTRQTAAVTEFANEAGWDPALLDNTLDIIEQQRDFALAEARKAIAGIPNQWDQVLANLEADMAEMDRVIGKDSKGREWVYNASRELIDKLRAADPEAIRNRLGFLDRALGATDGTSLAEVWNKASENEKHRLTAEQRRQREYQQYLLEHNYQKKVDSDYTASMTRLGYFDIDLTQSETLLNGSSATSTPEEKAAADKIIKDRMEAIEQVLKSSVKNYVDLLTIGDVSTADGRNRFLSLIFGENYDESAIVLRGIVESNGAELQVFYDQILKYVDDYTEAAKKAEERTKKLADFQWSHSDIKAKLDADEANNELYKKGLLQHRRPDEAEKRPDYGVYGNTRFVSDFGVDPEIEAYRLKIEAAKAYYDFLKAHGMEENQLHEQQKAIAEAQAAYVEKLTSRIKKQMDEVLGMHEPIENFGTKAGEAFALMTEDAEAGRKALKAAVGDMINDFMKQTVEMTKEYIKRRLMQKIHDRLTSVEASAHEAELTQIQTTGDTARLTHHEGIQTGITSIDKAQAIERETTTQEEVVSEVGTEAAGTGAKVSLGIAGGAAKTIGALGWWGIPLVAVITMLLNGLLSFAMSKVSSLFGGGKAASDSGAQAKLVSGMLTYDSGNVQAFRGVEDGKTYPVVGSDGKVYAAKDGGELSTGLVEDPITTLVNGQPALVAERGPEMVIGRETTAAMMMARPDILAEIVKFDRQRSGRTYRAYDSGNIDELQLPMPNGSNAEDMAQLRETINTLAMVLSALQRDGIPAHINQYGRGGVAQSARSGGKFMQRNSGDPLWRN